MNMSRYASYLGVVAAFLVVGVTGVYLSSSDVQMMPSGETLIPAVVDFPLVKEATTTVAEAPVAPEKVAVSEQNNTSDDTIALTQAASQLRLALVNIICYVTPESGLHSISGSGVIISPDGKILTNAHIAQYFLLPHRGVSCDIRTGSPAISTYKAALVYVSPWWIEHNATVLTDPSPVGTGEGDYALLTITGLSASGKMPTSFPYIPFASQTSVPGEKVAIVSYAAQFLTAKEVASSMFPTVVLGEVKDIFTFTQDTPDILGISGTAVAQEGSSGGGVANAAGMLVGTITTSKTSGPIPDRFLSALTAPYIRAAYKHESGRDLNTLLAQPYTEAIEAFRLESARLKGILEESLPAAP